MTREIVTAIEFTCNREKEIFIIEFPDVYLEQDGLIHHLVGCTDFVLLRAQGYFTTKYFNEVYGKLRLQCSSLGTRFFGLDEKDDRTIDAVHIGLNRFFGKLGFR